MKKKFFSVSAKIILLNLIILLISVVVVTFFVYSNQRNSMLEEADRTINLNIESLQISLQNLMLNGEAHIMVETLSQMKELSDYKEIGIYRTNGVLAFSDDQTLNIVNSLQSEYQFEVTDRLEDSRSSNDWWHQYSMVTNSVKTLRAVSMFLPDELAVEKYLPVINQRSCAFCHGSDHSVRGVIHIRLSVSSIYAKLDGIRNFLIIIFSILLIFLVFILFGMIRALILKPIFKIEDTVVGVGQGNFDQRVDFQRDDEIGVLAAKVNEMIQNVEERFHLSKYVSHSTEELIRSGANLQSGAEKKTMTILFSDVRNFTSYTESNDPEVVMENLNRVLQAQVQVIQSHGGDIDKFVGDEIMARFKDPLSAVVAAIRMIQAVKKSNKDSGIHLEVGLGINTGDVIAGNIGNEERREYAVIGDTVNLASRLCSIAKPHQVLISEYTYNKVKDQVQADKVSNQKIKGKEEAVNFYIVRSAHDPRNKS